jgi:hypothetical protein
MIDRMDDGLNGSWIEWIMDRMDHGSNGSWIKWMMDQMDDDQIDDRSNG